MNPARLLGYVIETSNVINKMNFFEFWGYFFESVKKKIEKAGSDHKSDEERRLEMEKYFRERDENEKQYREWFSSLTEKQKQDHTNKKIRKAFFWMLILIIFLFFLYKIL